MSNLPLLFVIGVAAIFALCVMHSRSESAMPRSKYVVIGLLGLGLASFGYVGWWLVADQYPIDFSLTPFVSFGLTMWVTALAYSAAHVLCKKDIAPSH